MIYEATIFLGELKELRELKELKTYVLALIILKDYVNTIVL